MIRTYRVIDAHGIRFAERPMCCLDGGHPVPEIVTAVKIDHMAGNKAYHWHAVGEAVDHYPWAIVYDEEPSSNKYGEIHP